MDVENNRLEVAPQKTEAVIMKGPRNRKNVYFTLREALIVPGKAVRYLGVMIPNNGTFGEHIEGATKKAEERASALARLMPNIGGLRTIKRQILCGAVYSILLYAAPIWYTALRRQKYRKAMEKVQRKALLRVVCAYRTVSTRALQVIAGAIPIELQAKERHLIYERQVGPSDERRKTIREDIVKDWQNKWEEEDGGGQWTKRIIPNISMWLKCEHRHVDYFMTQVLTGHGRFRSFAKKIGKADNDQCRYCTETDTAEHTFFHCARWVRERQEAYGRLERTLTVENMVPKITKSSEAWTIVKALAKSIMERKEKDERIQQ